MKSLKLVLLFSGVLAQSACTSAPTGSTTNTAASAAILNAPSADTTARLSNAISAALHGTRVALAPDAFTKSSQLTLERNTQNPRHMPGLNGRLMDMPVIHRFTLMSRSGGCYLVYEKTGKEYPLNGVSCKPMS